MVASPSWIVMPSSKVSVGTALDRPASASAPVGPAINALIALAATSVVAGTARAIDVAYPPSFTK